MPSEDPGPPAPPELDGPDRQPGPGPGVAPEDRGPQRLHLLSPVFFVGTHVRRLWPLALLLAARRQWWLLVLGALVLLAWSRVDRKERASGRVTTSRWTSALALPPAVSTRRVATPSRRCSGLRTRSTCWMRSNGTARSLRVSTPSSSRSAPPSRA